VVSIGVSGTPRTNLPVVFTATPIAGAIVTRYEWDFFDGQRATTFGPTVAHTYQQIGGYEVKVTAFGQTCGTATGQIGVVITP
jgi:PKD repeat protein